MEEITDSKTIKIKRLKKLLSCPFCKPHRGENCRKINIRQGKVVIINL